MFIVRQLAYPPADEADAQRAAGGGLVVRMSKEPTPFDVFDGDATLRALHASLDQNGTRECAMSTSLGNFINRSSKAVYKEASNADMKAATRASADMHNLTWPGLHKEILQPTMQCSSCGRRVKASRRSCSPPQPRPPAAQLVPCVAQS